MKTTPDKKLLDHITGRPLSAANLSWIESQIPAIRAPLAKLLILLLLMHIKMWNKKEQNIFVQTTPSSFAKAARILRSE
jgi:hypothetical protein